VENSRGGVPSILGESNFEYKAFSRVFASMGVRLPPPPPTIIGQQNVGLFL